MKEISIYARAGQGAITTAAILGTAVFLEERYALVFPHFGAARMGAPMNSFVRISDKEIKIRSQIYEPDYIMVADATLMRGFDVFRGLKQGGAAFINQKGKTSRSDKKDIKIFDIPADEISTKLFGKSMGNTVLLGAFSAGTGVVSLEKLYMAIEKKFANKLADLNKKAIEEGYRYFQENYA